MSEIHGVTLEEQESSYDGGYRPGRDAAVHFKANYASEEKKESLTAEIDTFMHAVHEVCCMAISNQRILWWIS